MKEWEGRKKVGDEDEGRTWSVGCEESPRRGHQKMAGITEK
jgi:hypothetical protein